MSADRIFAFIFTAVMLLWGASEVFISSRLRSKGEGTQRDAGTLKIVLLTAYLSLAVATYIAVADDGHIARLDPLGVSGLVMILVGIALRAYAILSLRRFFTVDVTVFADHRLIRSGPYRYLRHPSYTGALLSFYGLAVGFGNAWAAIVIVVPTTTAFLIRIRVEESALRAAFPAEFPEYERTTWRLIPFVY